MTRTRFYIGLKSKHGELLNLSDEAIVGRFTDERTKDLCQAFSIVRQMGVWKGDIEPSIVIECIHEDNKPSPIELPAIARDVAFWFEQEAVLFTTEKVFAKLVYDDENW